MDKNLRPYIAELIGTFALVFLSAAIVCTANLHVGSGQPQPYVIGIALAQGFALAAILSATMGVSGGYLNPAIALMLWVFKRIDGVKLAWLLGAQLLGAATAGLCVALIFSQDVLQAATYGAPHMNLQPLGGPATGTPDLKMLATGIAIEGLLTFILTFAIFGTIIDPRAPRMGGLGAGLAMTAIVLVGYGVTGAAVNPARWLGPAIWELCFNSGASPFRDHAVYWIGPIVGALAAGAVYLYVILPVEEAHHTTTTTTTTATSTAPVGVSTLFKAKK